MKKLILFISFMALVSLFTSCKKDKENTEQVTPTVTDSYPLKAGNYWVYKQTTYDAAGNVLNASIVNDTVLVLNDTIINNKTYHIVKDSHFAGNSSSLFFYLRDSADCIVNEYGNISFSIKMPGLICTQLSTPDSLTYTNFYCNSSSVNVTVPGGTFNCVEYYADVYRKADNFTIKYTLPKYCSKNIGPVKKTAMFVSNAEKVVSELISWHVQ